MSHILNLPLELHTCIIPLIDAHSLLNLCTTCKDYSCLLSHEYDGLWYSLVNTHLQKPLYYIYSNIYHYNHVNHTDYKSWFHLYIHFRSTTIDLFTAITRGFLEWVRLLLNNPSTHLTSNKELGINYYVIRDFGLTHMDKHSYMYYMYIASINNFIDILSVFLNNPRCHDTDELNTLFILCCKFKKTESIKFLLNSDNIDPTYDKNSAIIESIIHNNIDIVQILLQDPRINPIDQNYLAFNVLLLSPYPEYNNMLGLLLKDYRVIQSLGVGTDPAIMSAAIHNKIDSYVGLIPPM